MGKSTTYIPGIVWPAIRRDGKRPAQAILEQMGDTQWWPPVDILEHQFRQLQVLVTHACETVPFYRRRLRDAGLVPEAAATPDGWGRIPLLTRRDIQDEGADLLSTDPPPSHLPTARIFTSGSTGQPICATGTRITQAFWRAITMREILWHKRDTAAKLAAIRAYSNDVAKPPHGCALGDWGGGIHLFGGSGPAVALNVGATMGEQVAWLQRERPAYLLSYPTNIKALANRFLRTAQVLPDLRQVITFGEMLRGEVREACREAWGVSVADMYSSNEIGYMALQCPEHEHYHVQSESVLVEVIDEQGGPCKPGETGRVAVTLLHNFAMPLIRYLIGDYAEAGEVCPCGRGLPVLQRIHGRERNLMVLPGGERKWPRIGLSRHAAAEALPPIRWFQLAQIALDEVELRITADRKFTQREEDNLRDYLRGRLGYPFRISFRYLDGNPHGPGGKLEEFRCELDI